MSSAISELREWTAEISDFRRISALLRWDQETQMPALGASMRAEQVATLERLTHERFISERTGELIAAAIETGARSVHVTVGGSASTDGGAGAVAALKERGGLRGARLVVLCDVRTPFELAAEIFAPQKGATPEQVKLLAARLDELAAAMPRDPRGVPMTGAAGGLSGGLWAHFDAELVGGASAVLDAVDYDARMRRALAVVTGEGRIDRQSLVGKLVSEVATRARQAGVPCHAVVGRNELDLFDARILDLQMVLEASTLDEISSAGERLAGEIAAQRAHGA